MRFAHVTGILYTEANGFRIEITLDTRKTVEIVRDEPIASLLCRDGVPDPDWTIDQYTQETIGTILAEQGWEAISLAEMPPDADRGWAPPSVVYLVRG